ncbi:hypothetical protein [Microbulbifer variabilis]|uniref:hypothetical protein n=1 Tax=Microbulbifer variabilis TaxID=266805 RepID=UPI0003748715|nr:hypothetical protein [Microbulbifer variabilis]
MNIYEKLDELRKSHCPVRYEFEDRPLVLEIQYYLNSADQSPGDAESGFFVFAVNTDGFDMVLDIESGSEEIFQREFDDVDSIGLTLSDLMVSKEVAL